MENKANKLDELKSNIKKVIQESDEYKEYNELNALLVSQPDLKRKVDDFRRENFWCQYSDEVEDSIGAAEELQRRYSDLYEYAVVSRYLAAEMCLCRMVQEICMSVVESVDFDTDFLY